MRRGEGQDGSVSPMNVWTVLDHTHHMGGHVVGVAISLGGAKDLAVHDHGGRRLVWVEHPDGQHEADQEGTDQSYIVQRWLIEWVTG
jgi:hypothetical protein